MRIITTPMCEDILKIANLEDYEVVNVKDIANADIVVTLSETEVNMPKISVKLNTYSQLLDSINTVSSKFSTECDEDSLNEIKLLIDENNKKKYKRRNIKVKVYSNFLRDTVEDMGFSISEDNYDYIVIPDYMKENFDESEKIVIVPSHKNVSANIIERIEKRYQLLECKLCTKQ